MFAAVADVLAVDLAVETAGEQVIDGSAFWKTFGPGVALGLKFVPEEGRALAPMGVGEGEKLACHKVAGMCRYDVEKAGLGFGVAESFQGIEMGGCNVHSVRIPAVISRSSRTRRKRDASSERAYIEKPADGFCRHSAWPVVTRREFQVHVAQFEFGGLILDTQIGDRNLSVDELQAVLFRDFASCGPDRLCPVPAGPDRDSDSV